MSAVQLQADVGQLSIQGLGAFSTVLTVLSADNVAPMAMIQMEQFGNLFNVSGKFAAQTPDLLKRFSAKPLGRLAMAIGWRKNDSASLLAESAGGQAAALISVGLRNLYSGGKCGEIIHRFSTENLPKQAAISSIQQLNDVADLLANKMSAVGFGNYLAQQAVRISTAYQLSGLGIPLGLLESLSIDSMSDLLGCCSKALQQDATMLRVTGTAGMGHIVGLILFLFPDDTTLLCSGTVMHEGARQNILLELSPEESLPTMTLEHRIISRSPSFLGPIQFRLNAEVPSSADYRQKWHGWLAERLQLALLGAGLPFAATDGVDAANLLVSLMVYDIPDFGSLSDMLGANARHRMTSVCEEIILSRPTEFEDPRSALLRFMQSLQDRIIRASRCQCISAKYTLASRWDDLEHSHEFRCSIRELWRNIGKLIEAGLSSFFVLAEPNATISTSYGLSDTYIQDLVDPACFRTEGPEETMTMKESVYDVALHLSGVTDQCYGDGPLVLSQGSTVYPQPLETMAVTYDLGLLYRLVDGMMMADGRYHTVCFSGREQRDRHIVRRFSPIVAQELITPSAIGAHTDLSMTIRETRHGLELRLSCSYGGMVTELWLDDVFRGYGNMVYTAPCLHSTSSPLSTRGNQVRIASVATPVAFEEDVITIVMTKGDPTAQLLSCTGDAQAILMIRCCLDCAVQQAKERNCRMIIVA